MRWKIVEVPGKTPFQESIKYRRLDNVYLWLPIQKDGLYYHIVDNMILEDEWI